VRRTRKVRRWGFRCSGTEDRVKASGSNGTVNRLKVDHLYFVAELDDHHLARIWEILKN